MPAAVYEPGATFLHRADAAAKIAALGVWFLVAVLLTRPGPVAALAALVALVALVTGLWRVLVRFAVFIVTLFLVCALLWSLFSFGPGPEAGAPGALARGLVMAARLTVMLAMGLLFLASTRIEDVATGLRRLGLPYPAAFALTLAFRLVPLFAGSAATIVAAQACRGLDVREGGPVSRLRRYLPLLVPLVLVSLRSADGLAMALESRGLGMQRQRTSVVVSRFGPGEAVGVALSFGVLAAVIWLKLLGAVV